MDQCLEFDPAPGRLEPLADGIRRILAPNPSPMTFRGTNTYVVGQGRVAVIDPGPDDARHLAALREALRGEVVTHILVTHAHRDHSALAGRLSQDCGAPVFAFGDALAGRSALMAGLASRGLAGGGEGVDAAFAPSRRLSDGERVEGEGWGITALHTPGHMANHMSFVLGDAIFSGDLAMGWATSLVSPPDGDLGAYLESCGRLLGLGSRVLYPGHGAPVADPAARLDWLIAHREERTGQILRALATGPAGIARLRALVYGDLDPILHPAAERNVFAHLVDLETKNRIGATPELSPDATFALI